MATYNLTKEFTQLTETSGVINARVGTIEIATSAEPVAGEGVILRAGMVLPIAAEVIYARAVKNPAQLNIIAATQLPASSTPSGGGGGDTVNGGEGNDTVEGG